MRSYLDYNASAPLRPEVQQLLVASIKQWQGGNASSIHFAGQEARKRLEAARTRVASLLERKPSETIFTSGGTEADNLAIKAVMHHPNAKTKRLVVSTVEHPAVLAVAKELEAEGVDVKYIPVDKNGVLQLDELQTALKVPTALVSVIHVNNETGIVTDLAPIRALCTEHNALLHVDAVQAAGRTPLFANADLISLSGHKLGAPQGVGVLGIRSDLPLRPQILGGPQERDRRAGTENVLGAIAMAEALALTLTNEPQETSAARKHQEQIESQLRTLAGVTILGSQAKRAANTTLAVFENVDGDSLLQALDLEGIAVSSGSACSSGSLEPSHVLLEMGLDAKLALSSVRISTGFSTSDREIDHLSASLPKVLAQVRHVC